MKSRIVRYRIDRGRQKRLIFKQEQGSSHYISPHSTKNRYYDTERTTLENGRRTCYFYRQLRSVVVPSSDILHLPQSKHAFCHAPKDSMFSVQERCRCGSNEELRWVNSCHRDSRKPRPTWQPFVFGPEFAYKEKVSEDSGGDHADGEPSRGDLAHRASR